jgi:xanthine dehydrogenase accessory factor
MDARPFFLRVAEIEEQGRRFALATVVRTQGSTPQVVGAKMVVVEDEAPHRAAGTLGGGCVEADAMLSAREVLQTGARSLRAYQLTEDLAWNTGLVCGGTMWILVERGEDALSLGGQSMLPDLVRAAEGGPPVAVVTLLAGRRREVSFGGRVYVDSEGRLHGTLGDAALDAEARQAGARQLEHGTPRLVPIDESRDLLVDPVSGRPRLVVAGGGHVALAIARQAQLLDFDVTIVEDRPEFADPVRFGGATVLHGDIAATLGSLDYGWSSFIVIATRGHKLDADCVLAAVRTKARYIGLLGSRRKTVLVTDLLREHGIADDRIGAIHAPVGLDLGGRTPAEIALSVMAEITRARYRGTGQSLRDR